MTSATARLRPLTSSQPLARAYLGRANSFGLIRLAFALLVLLHHSMVLGFGRPITNRVDLGSLAVTGFFVVSGFLITRSALRASLPRYLWHRFLRIMPALWVCLLVTALVVAPVLFWLDHGTTDTLWRSTNGVINYLVHNWTNGGQQFGIADVALNTPYGSTVGTSVLNGSLWSLAYELLCYVAVGALAVAGVLRRARWLVLFAAIVGCAVILWNSDFGGTFWADPATRTGSLPYFGVLVGYLALWYCTAFLLGAAAALYAGRIPVNDVLGWVSVVTAGVLIGTGNWSSPAMIAFAYATLWAAIRLPAAVQWIGRRNDYSYGVYIYAFVVQQVLATFGVHRGGFILYTVASLAGTAVLAFASWHLVEKHALRLKGWTPALRWLPSRAAGIPTQPAPALGGAHGEPPAATAAPTVPGPRPEPDPTPATP